METSKLVKHAAIATVTVGAAIAAPHLAPFLFFPLRSLLGEIYSQEGSAGGDSVGKLTVQAVSDVLKNIAASALWEAPRSLGTRQNEDLTRALAHAYRDALGAFENEIGGRDDARLKEQAGRVLPLVRARIDRALKAGTEDALLALFPLKKEGGGSGRPDARDFANRLTSKEFILELSDDSLPTREVLTTEIEISVRRWLNEERAHGSWGLTRLGLSRDEELREPLRAPLLEKLSASIPHHLGQALKDPGLQNSWVAFQRSHLQAILKEVRGSRGLSDEDKEFLASRLGVLAGQDFPKQLAESTSEILTHLNQSEEGLRRCVSEESAKCLTLLRGVAEGVERVEANTEKLLSHTEKILSGVERLGAAHEAPRDGRPPDPLKAFLKKIKPADDPEGTRRFSYEYGFDSFAGRNEVVNRLLAGFLAPPDSGSPPFQYCYVEGEAGVGKSRLALELVRRVEQHWTFSRVVRSIYYNKRAIECLCAFDWEPREPTFIVIDYAAEVHADVRQMLSLLAERREEFEHPLRIMLLARSTDQDVMNELAPKTSEGGAVAECRAEKITLTGLSAESCVEIMRGRIRRVGGRDKDFGDKELDDTLAALDPERRPLWAAIVGELIGTGAWFLSAGAKPDAAVLRRTAMQLILGREREMWEKKAEPSTGARRQKALVLKHEKLLALATMTRGATLKRVWGALDDSSAHLLPGPGEFDYDLYAYISDHEVEFREGGDWLSPLEPDLLGECFVDLILSERRSDESPLKELAWRLDAPGMAEFAVLFEFDFGLPQSDPLRFLPDAPPRAERERLTVSKALIGLSYTRVWRLFESEKWSNPSPGAKSPFSNPGSRNELSKAFRTAGDEGGGDAGAPGGREQGD